MHMPPIGGGLRSLQLTLTLTTSQVRELALKYGDEDFQALASRLAEDPTADKGAIKSVLLLNGPTAAIAELDRHARWRQQQQQQRRGGSGRGR